MSKNDGEIHVYVSSQGPRCKSRNLLMRYRDPVTGKSPARSTGTTNRREAERLAAKWEAELNEGRYCGSRITWPVFRERYERERLASLAEKTQDVARTALNHLERLIAPKHLAALTADVLSHFQALLREEAILPRGKKKPKGPGRKRSESTIAKNLRSIDTALRWAAKKKLLAKAPDIDKPHRAKGRKARGRAVTGEEFDRMIAAIRGTDEKPGLFPHDPDGWERYLRGLWLSGLRLGESLELSWDADAAFTVDLAGRHPMFRIYAEGQKSHRDQTLPMTPDFAEFLLATPPADRHGPVFVLRSARTGERIKVDWVKRMVARIGRAAGVVVNKAAGKYASAHDLRRSFGTRWARRVKPATLQKLMRHASIQTTMDYYVDLDADELAAELWSSFTPEAADTIPHTIPTPDRPPASR